MTASSNSSLGLRTQSCDSGQWSSLSSRYIDALFNRPATLLTPAHPESRLPKRRTDHSPSPSEGCGKVFLQGRTRGHDQDPRGHHDPDAPQQYSNERQGIPRARTAEGRRAHAVDAAVAALAAAAAPATAAREHGADLHDEGTWQGRPARRRPDQVAVRCQRHASPGGERGAVRGERRPERLSGALEEPAYEEQSEDALVWDGWLWQRRGKLSRYPQGRVSPVPFSRFRAHISRSGSQTSLQSTPRAE